MEEEQEKKENEGEKKKKKEVEILASQGVDCALCFSSKEVGTGGHEKGLRK